MRFDVRQGGDFRDLIRALNELESAPPLDAGASAR
jgi:hypothetical protein